MVIQQQPSSLSDRPQVSSMVKSRRRSVSPAEPSYRLAQALVKQEKWQEAIAAYQQALIITPNWVEVQRELGDLFLKLERWDEAVEVYETAIGLRSDGAEVYHNLGDALLKLQRWEDAIAAYQKAIELNPEFSWSYNNLGDGLRELQRWDQAAQAYQKAIELKPDFALSHHNLGDVLVKKEDWENAIAAYQKAVDLDPNFVWSHYNLGDVLVKKEDWENAIAAYRAVIKLDPNLPQVHEKLGDALQHQIQSYSEEISQVYHRAVADNPTDLQVYYKALEVNPKDAEMCLKLADILKSQGKLEQAVTFYKSTLQIEPNNPEIQAVAWQQLGDVLRKLGKDDKVVGVYRSVITQNIVLFTPYYQANQPERQDELIYCLKKNIECPEIEKIVLLIDDGYQPELESPKIEIVQLSSRATYLDWIELTQKKFPDKISVLANTDIYLDESIAGLREIFSANPNGLVAISRHEQQGSEQTLHENPHQSQDVWAVCGDYKFTESLKKSLSVPLGLPRCDAKIAYLFSVHGAKVYNPCNHIKIVHVHETQSRSYDKYGDTTILGSTAWVYPSENLSQPSKLKMNVWTLNPDEVENIQINHSLIRWREEQKDQDSASMTTALQSDVISAILEKSQEKIRQFHNKHLGERCVIIGNGPSLNEMDLSFLKDEICFGTNKIFLGFERWNFSPTYYVAVNPHVIEQSVDQIRNISCPKFIGNRGVSFFDPSDDLIFIKTFPSPEEAFSKSPDVGLNEGSTVTYVAMQLAYYMGFSEVILIGVDHHFVTQGTPYEAVVSGGNDPNHFDPNYFGKGLKWQLPDLDASEKSYQVAKKVFEESGRKIIDATVNGRCQTFPKQDYKKIFQEFSQKIDASSFINSGNVLFAQNKFDEAIYAYEKGIKIDSKQPSQVYENLGECLARQNQCYPRLLLIDWIKTGSISATGQIKEKLLAEYPADNWLQLYIHDNKEFKLFAKGKKSLEELTFLDRDTLIRECKNFNPSVIYYRPVSDNLEFHDLACEIITDLKVPLVTHIMDDWMGRLFHQNLEIYTKLDKSFHTLLKNSVIRLSICEKMSKDFKDRYDLDFVPIANCIDVNDWLNSENHSKPESEQDEKKIFKVCYVGGLADDMNFHSISDLVEAIEKLADTLPVKLEIYTMKHWQEKAIKAFSKFTATTIYEANLSQEDYYRLLKSADALIVAYNFDFNSIAYTKYSMANKLPECLASGVPTIVYGPLEVATVEYAAQSNCVQLVTERNQVQLMDAIRQLINNYDFGKELGKRAQQFSFENHSGSKIRQKFYNILSQASLTYSYLETTKLPEKLSNEVSKKSTKKSSSSFKTHLDVGIKLEQDGNLTKALEEFLAAAELNTSHPEIYHRIGEVYLRQKKYKEALSSYQKALEISPKHYWSWRGLGDIYLEQGNLPKAIDSYHQCLEIEPNYFYGHQRLGQIYQQQNLFKEAMTCYKKALEIKPHSKEAKNSILLLENLNF
jgi:tetratricopeptide (TPR) repeat protein